MVDHGRPWSDAGLTIIDHELTITNWPWSVSDGFDHHDHVMTMVKLWSFHSR